MSSQAQDTRDEIVASVRLPREQHERLHALARAEHRTLSGHLRLILDRYFADLDGTEPVKLERAA